MHLYLYRSINVSKWNTFYNCLVNISEKIIIFTHVSDESICFLYVVKNLWTTSSIMHSVKDSSVLFMISQLITDSYQTLLIFNFRLRPFT